MRGILKYSNYSPPLPIEKNLVISWEKLYRKVKSSSPLNECRALLAYNTVLDRVVSVDEKLLSKLPKPLQSQRIRRIRNLQDFANALAYSIRNDFALEVVCDKYAYELISELGSHTEKTGGQAAIVSNLLSKFPKTTVIVHADRYDSRAASLFKNSNVKVGIPSAEGLELILAKNYTIENVEPQIHYIFEYRMGTSFASGRAGRSNRIIACPTTPIKFQEGWEDILPDIAQNVDFAFIAGLNHMGDDYEDAFYKVVEHIRLLRLGNPRITIHLELTSTQDLMKLSKIFEIIIRKVDSVGLNEAELIDVMNCLGHKPDRGPLGQVEGMLSIMGLGPKRVHLHTMHYYLCKVRGSEKTTRDGLVFGALIGAAAALRGCIPRPRDLTAAMKVPVSQQGINILKAFEQVWLKQETEELATQGFLDGFGLVAIPTKIVVKPKGTVGLGDMISSASLAAEIAFNKRLGN